MSGTKKRKRVSKGNKRRLRPGELDRLVLSYMRDHEERLPLTASAVGKGIGRSSGAVANYLTRLVKGKQVRRAKRKPLAYDLKVAKTASARNGE
jgi:hypothetical protein